MEKKRKTLLERFEIPINHLDFAYVKQCDDAREMEKIVQILRSGEEGYFPDLTICAEDRLRALKPQSRLFRFEEPLRSHDSMSTKEWQPIYNWTHEIKTQDNKLAELNNSERENADGHAVDLPPIRKAGKIAQNVKNQSNTTTAATAATTPTTMTSTTTTTATTTANTAQRIKSTDYSKWDKYDADEELLRMDLAEERASEEVERQNRINLQKCNAIVEGKTKQEVKPLNVSLLHKLTDIERDKLAEDYRLRGNDYFRTKEYESAIAEYSRAIDMRPEAAAACYNNRAIANIKLQNFLEAIDDCERCLQLEPLNVKARLRLAEATYCHGRRRESYALYEKVLELEPTNAVALKATTELRTQLGELPPAHATRLQIQECTTQQQLKKTPTKTSQPIESETPPATVDYDLAELVKPNRIVQNKLANAAEALSSLKPQPPQSKPQSSQTAEAAPPPFELSIDSAAKRAKQYGRLLIEEL